MIFARSIRLAALAATVAAFPAVAAAQAPDTTRAAPLPAADSVHLAADTAAPAPTPAVAAAPASAASTRALARGDMVRGHCTSGAFTGTIVRLTPDTMVLSTSRSVRTSVPLGTVTDLQRADGHSRRASIMRGVAIGFLGGAALGLGGGLAFGKGRDCAACARHTEGSTVVLFTAIGALVGPAIGAMVGPSLRAQRWEPAAAAPPPAATPAVSFGIAPGRTLAATIELRI